MNPNQPTGQTQQPFDSSQYDFITDPGKSKRPSLFSFGKGNKSGTLIIIAAGLGLLTVILLVGSLFLGGGGDDRTALLSVARKQSEVIAVAELGAEDGGSSQAQGLALAVQLALTTEQQAVVAQMSKKEVKAKEYAAGPSSEVTQQLEAAQRNGRFDEVFSNVIKQELTEYQQILKAANTEVRSKNAKALLANDFESAGILLQIPSAN